MREAATASRLIRLHEDLYRTHSTCVARKPFRCDDPAL